MDENRLGGELMEKRKTTGRKISSVIALQTIGSSLVISSIGPAMQDSWIVVIIAVGLSILLAWMYGALLKLYPDRGFLQIFQEVFGNTAGKAICGIYAAYAVFAGAQTFYIYNEFIKIVGLNETPQVAILMVSLPLIIWQVRSGPDNIGSCSKFLLPIALIFVGLTFLLGIPFMDADNLKPVLGSGPTALVHGTFSTLVAPFGETVLAVPFFGVADRNIKPLRVMVKGILIGGAVLLTATLRNLMILGAPTCRLFLFVSYDAVGIISIGDFVSRISVLIGINLVLSGIVRIDVSLYAASLSVSEALGTRGSTRPAACCGLLMVVLGYILYNNMLSAVDFIPYIPAIGIPFQFIFPLIALITGRIKSTRRKKQAGNGAGERQQCRENTEN
jgi:spore germination protein KB